MEQSEIQKIKLNDIEIDEDNVRKTNAHDNIDELAESIKELGLMQPIVLRGNFGKPPYKVVIGQRRFLAHQFNKEKYIEARFIEDVPSEKAKIISLSENIHRKELNHADLVEAITFLYNKYKKNVKKVSKVLGISVRKINDYIRIDQLASDKIMKLLNNNKISPADAKRAIIAAMGIKEKADEIIDVIVKLTTAEQKNNLVNYAKINPKATISELEKEAMKPKVEETVFLKLPKEVTKAVRKASSDLSLDIDILTLNVLTTWLADNSYLK